MDEKTSNDNSWPVQWAKVSFVLVLIGIGIVVLGYIVGGIEQNLREGNIVLNFIRPYIEIVGCFFPLIVLFLSISGLVSFIGLLRAKEKTKKPYIYALTSFIIGLSLIWTVAITSTVGLIKIHKETVSGKAKSIEHECTNNLHELGMACLGYWHDHDRLPAKDKWCDILKTDIESQKPSYDGEYMNFFLCPEDTTGPCSYAINENIPDDVNKLPWDMVLFFESKPGWNSIGGIDDVVTDRHTILGANIVFFGGRAEFIEAERIPNLLWALEENK
ncbi:MAG: hypothetical protein ISS71_08060 [Phycisphaerae bacterium]|nr:hypothetical protein [Phycisphaerae bacterium]